MRPIFLGGRPQAAVLQLAHPFVAYGVEHHSKTRADVVGRFQADLRRGVRDDLGLRVRASSSVDAVGPRDPHAVLTGVVCDYGISAAGTRYHANDVDALLWVYRDADRHGRAGHRAGGRDVTAAKDAYYRDTWAFARLFDDPRRMAIVPRADWAAFTLRPRACTRVADPRTASRRRRARWRGASAWPGQRQNVLGGGRASWSQLAHPMVAHAIDHHSKTRTCRRAISARDRACSRCWGGAASDDALRARGACTRFLPAYSRREPDASTDSARARGRRGSSASCSSALAGSRDAVNLRIVGRASLRPRVRRRSDRRSTASVEMHRDARWSGDPAPASWRRRRRARGVLYPSAQMSASQSPNCVSARARVACAVRSHGGAGRDPRSARWAARRSDAATRPHGSRRTLVERTRPRSAARSPIPRATRSPVR